MVKVVSMAKTSTVNHSIPVVHAKLPACCQDLEEWPRSWMGFAEDIPPGEKMVAYFRPFIEHLIGLNLSQKTIRKHDKSLSQNDGMKYGYRRVSTDDQNPALQLARSE